MARAGMMSGGARGTPTGSGINVGQGERVASTVLGAALVLLGLERRSPGGVLAALAGGSLLYRGVTGHCEAYKRLGVDTAEDGSRHADGQAAGVSSQAANDVQRTVTVGRPADELHQLWRAPETLPKIMGHFAEIAVIDRDRARYTVHGPGGRSLAWETQVVEEKPGDVVRWETLPGADMPNEGTLRFAKAPDGLGTEVALRLRFSPPGGALGSAAMRLLGAVPSAIVAKILRRFKSLAETGEMPTLEHNPSARGRGDIV